MENLCLGRIDHSTDEREFLVECPGLVLLLPQPSEQFMSGLLEGLVQSVDQLKLSL